MLIEHVIVLEELDSSPDKILIMEALTECVVFSSSYMCLNMSTKNTKFPPSDHDHPLYIMFF